MHGEAEFGQRAHHAVRLHAPQLALFNFHAARQGGAGQGNGNHCAGEHIIRAGDDLDGFISHIHLAHHQFVRVGMPLYRQDFSHDHLGELFTLDGVALHLGTGHGESLGVFSGGGIYGYIIRKPFHGQIHWVLPPLLMENPQGGKGKTGMGPRRLGLKAENTAD